MTSKEMMKLVKKWNQISIDRKKSSTNNGIIKKR